MSAAVRAVFGRQAAACRQLDSPFTSILLGLLSERLTDEMAVGQALLDWPGDPAADALPLRIAGALHALVLTGKTADLAGFYPPHLPEGDDNRLWQAIEDALFCHGSYLLRFIESPPQTNEVARSSALAAGCATVAMIAGNPLAILEIGASAGLNLHWEWFSHDLGGVVLGQPGAAPSLKPNWQGPPPPSASVTVQERAGCDRRPIDRRDSHQLLRLRAYVWPDQATRLRHLDQALATIAASPVEVDAVDAPDWLEIKLGDRSTALTTVLFHSIVWQYLDQGRQERLTATIRKAGALANRKAPLAWLRMEPGPNQAAELGLTLWPGGRDLTLADVDYHGRWIRWHHGVEAIRHHFSKA